VTPRWTNCLLGALAIRRRFGGRLVMVWKGRTKGSITVTRVIPHFMVVVRGRLLHCTDRDVPENEQGTLIGCLPWLCCKMRVQRIRHPRTFWKASS
jgi:hypothetical protein